MTVENESQNGRSHEKENQRQTVDKLPEEYRIFGENLRIERKKHGYSIKDIAALLNVSSSYVSLMERGGCNPSLSVIYYLCDIFDVTPNYFFMERKADETAGVEWNGLKTAYKLINRLSDRDMNIIVEIMKKMIYKALNE